MEGWSSAAKGALPSGWSRHPDGYVRTGQFAMFKPTRTFSDYKFEFFGEIEKRSMGWAVRAKDSDNYYAMKFSVLEAGLRPVIAMVHYPVIGGKRGHRTENPAQRDGSQPRSVPRFRGCERKPGGDLD